MAIFVPAGLPAAEKLRKEKADILPYSEGMPENVEKILILNLMPTKQATETQLIRMLSAAGKNVAVYLMNTVTYTSRNTDGEYLSRFYQGFSAFRDSFFDGLIVTGAPVEHLDFTQVLYWNELCEIFDWAKTHVRKLYTICWGAQAALMHYYGIKKHPLPEKMFGIFDHTLLIPENPLCKGVPSHFRAPHSRNAEELRSDIEACNDLDILAVSPQAGVLWVASKDKSLVCMTGHPEYDAETLSLEYFRDLEKGDNISCPKNYFPADNPAAPPPLTWRETAKTIYSNWVKMQ